MNTALPPYSRALRAGLLLTLGLALSLPAATPEPENIRLAETLSRDGDHAASALEFRRLAMGSTSACTRASFYWAAAYEYRQAGEISLVEKMLDQAENNNPGLSQEALLLRGDNSAANEAWPEAEFYFQGLTKGTPPPVARLASRKLAAIRLHQHNVAGAREALRLSPADEQSGLQSLDAYRRGSDKSPRIGGLLGLIPGLGYAYSGEYANAGRSLILNSLFIFGMVQTGKEDQWGAFAAISFFEATWYSGSIYGGIDAATRYNQTRLDNCAADITGHGQAVPDYAQLPILTLQFKF